MRNSNRFYLARRLKPTAPIVASRVPFAYLEELSQVLKDKFGL
jgi:hypothetical protein